MLNRIRDSYFQYKNIKIVVTTRLLDKIPENLKITTDYLRLLSFSKSQVNKYFQGLERSTSRSPFTNIEDTLTYDDLTKFGLAEDEINKPLLDWMVFKVKDFIKFILNDNKVYLNRRYNVSQLSSNAKSTLLYIVFFLLS